MCNSYAPPVCSARAVWRPFQSSGLYHSSHPLGHQKVMGTLPFRDPFMYGRDFWGALQSMRNSNSWYSNELATFGDRVASAREARGVSEEELSDRLGIMVGTLRSWEQDRSEPRANRLPMLCGMLNVSLRWLLTGDGDDIRHSTHSPQQEIPTGVLTELQQLRAEMARNAERLERIEKRLQAATEESACSREI